ncbi:hypothetical protein AVEN_196769-1 [Araneus ventricosus]|uniref:Uncharacterized protein n=1 Tax=Araneus ventricosus TaxID=182803 RepID=A0A4Y2QXH7_ARAVE|nr:hypothetical protein AVEN_196769-1 [Araneus ventricosus]
MLCKLLLMSVDVQDHSEFRSYDSVRHCDLIEDVRVLVAECVHVQDDSEVQSYDSVGHYDLIEDVQVLVAECVHVQGDSEMWVTLKISILQTNKTQWSFWTSQRRVQLNLTNSARDKKVL